MHSSHTHSLSLSMDSRTRLDYALFQLTPTRTRFDLVLFSGGNSEKLASGIFEPFISHLKFARDQISKGGYSITLRPPTNDAPWFNRATFQRFVHFVSTPAVLERFVSIEKEILQIESSVQANKLSDTNVAGQLGGGTGSWSPANSNTKKSADSPESKGEIERNDDAVLEENSKIQLQRRLETRKSFLQKEQAMAYVRGHVAGFEIDNIDDLISFAEAFGALRLREACSNFKELCKKKHEDILWMAELAATEACSPSELSFPGTSCIVLTNETSAPIQNNMLNFHEGSVSTDNLMPNESLDASKSDSTPSHGSFDSKKDDSLPASDQTPSITARIQVPMPWPNQIPQYMYNFQGPIQQHPPYQGYHFPPIQHNHSHYPRNMQWSPNMKESSVGLVQEADYHRNQKSFSGRKGPEYSREDRQNESSDSDFGNDSDSYIQQDRNHSSLEHPNKRKQRRKSSRTVVIRNINYITPKRRNVEKGGVSDESSSDEDEFIDKDSLKQKVADAVESFKKSHKSNSNYHRNRGACNSHPVSNGSDDATVQSFDDNLVANAFEGNENWDAFKNLLIRDEEVTVNGVESLHPIDVRDELFTVRNSEDGPTFAISPAVDQETDKVLMQRTVAADSFFVTEREGGSEGRVKHEDFENGENFRPVVKVGDCMDRDLLFSQRLGESGSDHGGVLSTCAIESSIIKNGSGQDWFIVDHSRKPENSDVNNSKTILDGDCILSLEGDPSHTEKSRKDILMDDSFLIMAQSAVDNINDSQWKTDISMIADLTLASQPENGAVDVSQNKHEIYDAYQPNDLCMVLERNSEFESAEVSWTTDYGMNISFPEANRRCSGIENSDHVDEKLPSNRETNTVKSNGVHGTKEPGKEARPKVLRGSHGKSKSENMCKSKKPSIANRPVVHKSKLEKEEEIRKKMEELLIQRQQRIADRTAASNFAPAASKKIPSESKTVKGSIKCDKTKTHSTTRETNRVSSVKITAT